MEEAAGEVGTPKEVVAKTETPLPKPTGLTGAVSPPPAEGELKTEPHGTEERKPAGRTGLLDEELTAIDHLRKNGATDSQIVEFLRQRVNIAEFNKKTPEELKAIFGNWNEKWINGFDALYEAEDRRGTYAMAPYWAGAVHTIELTMDKLTRISAHPDSKAMRSKAEAIFAAAKKGMEYEDYRTNTGRVTASLVGPSEPIDTATKEILSASDVFVKKAEVSTPDDLVEAANLKLKSYKDRMSSGDMSFLLWPASITVLEKIKPEFSSTQEDKLVWALFADTMTDYFEKHYQRRMLPK